MDNVRKFERLGKFAHYNFIFFRFYGLEFCLFRPNRKSFGRMLEYNRLFRHRDILE